MSAEYGVALIESGSAAEIERGEAVINAVLLCQDMDERSPHYGNFRWEYEDGAVEDLNAVQFVLIRLIPLLLQRFGPLVGSVGRAGEEIGSALPWMPCAGLMCRRCIRISSPKTSPTQFLGGQLLGAPEYTAARRAETSRLAELD